MSIHDPKIHHRNAKFSPRNFRKKMMNRKSRQSRGRPMTRFRINNRFKPPQNDKEWIRLLPEEHIAMDGSNAPYYEYLEHFNATLRRGTICSRAWKETPEGEIEGSGKCIPCYEIEEEGAHNISARRLSGFLLLCLDWHYLIPSTNNNGEIVTYQKDSKFHKAGDVIFDRVHEADAVAEYSKASIKREGYERVFGKLMHWSLGINHLLVLSSVMDDLENECKCGGEIKTVVWECPKCGHEVFDLTDDNCDYTEREIKQLVTNRVSCPNCDAGVFLEPVRECNRCKDPRPLEIWDVDLQVGREGEGTSSQLVVGKHRHKDIDERCVDIIPDNNILQRVFAGDSLEYQSEAMRVPNPWKSSEAREHVQDYQDEKDDPADEDIPF